MIIWDEPATRGDQSPELEGDSAESALAPPLGRCLGRDGPFLASSARASRLRSSLLASFPELDQLEPLRGSGADPTPGLRRRAR